MPASPAGRVVVVTDSTAYLPAARVAGLGIEVVPLRVDAGAVQGFEGTDVTPAAVVPALRSRHVRATTSRPATTQFADVFSRARAAGAAGVVSVHLSGALSGTADAARSAAAQWPDGIRVVDSRSTCMGLGFPVLAAAELASSGAGLDEVAARAEAVSRRTTTLFYVDNLEHLRRGGRIGAARALLGTALSVKPLLHVSGGHILPLERVRTPAKAIARLAALAGQAAGDARVDIAVHHLAAPERADALAALVRESVRCIGELLVLEVGAVIGAHVGPGVLGVVVSRRSARGESSAGQS